MYSSKSSTCLDVFVGIQLYYNLSIHYLHGFMVLPPETAVATEQWGLVLVCACLLILVGKLRLGFSSATPVSGKPYMGTCQRLVCLLCWWSWGWGEWAALFRFQDSLQMSQPAPTQTDCYLGNSGLGFPQQYLSTDSSAPILTNTHTGAVRARKQHPGWIKLSY